jgi:hypothetical protein
VRIPATTSSPCAFAGARVVALVPEHHLDDVDRGAEVVRNSVHAPVDLGARGVPRVEDGPHRALELDAWVLGEVMTSARAVDLLEPIDELAQVLRLELDVVANPFRLLHRRDRLLELVRVHSVHDVPVHLDQPTVGVPREARVAGRAREAVGRLVVQAEVEDRLHHPRHRDGRARADRDEKGVVRVAEALPGGLLEALEMPRELFREACRELAAVLDVLDTGRGRDGEACRDRNPDRRHLRKARPLAPEELTAEVSAFREVVDTCIHGSGDGFSHVARFRRVPLGRQSP